VLLDSAPGVDDGEHQFAALPGAAAALATNTFHI
jgi:hypothetical protein